jgi:flagellar basal-body rod modification protein FlgD
MTEVTGISSTSTTGSTSSTYATEQFDQEMFLKLLVAQLQYQNPESPADATEFIAQSAQFAMVERLNALQDLDEQMLGLVRSQSAASLVGKSVTWTDQSGTEQSGTVTSVTQGTTPSVFVGNTELSLDEISKISTSG